ncbi:MAG: hypothetical protein Q8O84_04220 [Nanoarchaeota archaeon]|nr:hypothetical protein [Nanoarchaeota archaeon]
MEIEITEDMLIEARQNVKKYNTFNLFCGDYAQKLAGEVGRLALRKYLIGASIPFVEDTRIGNKDEFDFKIKDKNVSLKTQLVNYLPEERWRCEVNEKQLNNPCDFHLFAKTNLSKNKVWLVGIISKDRFDNKGILRKEGEIMEDNFKKWAIKETKKDVSILELDPINAFSHL